MDQLMSFIPLESLASVQTFNSQRFLNLCGKDSGRLDAWAQILHGKEITPSLTTPYSLIPEVH
ncbi:hypothetical protein [Rhodopirellula sp. SWK7]|uniref:hypothetical protein n=1 Tax=Rhodopirellula sp. SWK7 TaxID=595460 RepID=UPI001F4395AF|nr:hypothetical protein [Rhodopirellula sp. SWK7]